MDVLDIACEGGFDAEHYANIYPGFPKFVHDIMAGVSKGQTPEEAANASATGLSERLTDIINEINQTHAFFNEEGEVQLPENVKKAIEESGALEDPPDPPERECEELPEV